MTTADKALARGSVRTANTTLDFAIRAFGNSYRQPVTIDDTGMRLTLATFEQGKGRHRAAARLKRTVLADRLEQCGVTAKR